MLVVSILNNSLNTHPFVPVRLKRVQDYAASPEYERVLRGEYERDPLGLHEGGVRLKCACGAKVNIKLSFCPQCGRPNDPEQQQPAPIEAASPPVCAGCGRFLAPEANFCPKCGAKNDAPPPDAGASPLDKLKAKAAGLLKRP